ncbi:AMP-dependent synthetase/ligase [Pseudonocardia pini]|uniref:AMP-dependent synthetase/ligase n=1 Tax=Pseudonocardia pini TaxID=2758030 RepID=UPI0015F01AD6|nr:AMP-dependent synthetase/ligase [Pseudonocardia pini]
MSTVEQLEKRAPGIGAGTLCAAFQQTVAADPSAPALQAHGGDAVLTRAQYAAEVERIAGGLAALGVGRGDPVGLMLTNRPEFHLVDTAALHLGAVPFSIYNTSSPDQIEYLLGHAENRVLVCEPQFVERVAAASTPHLEHVVVVGEDSFADLAPSPGFDLASAWRAVEPSDVATLIYTSGTTGPPKGVELTHANVMFVLDTCERRFPFATDGACLSYLPSAHMADRIFSHYLHMATGWPLTTVADASQVFAAVAAVRPTWFLGVPRIWEKLRQALLRGFGALPEDQRSAVEQALEAALAEVRRRQDGAGTPGHLETPPPALAAVAGRLGFDRIALMMTGAAPIAPAVHEFFLALGLPLMEGFGMSETGALGMTNLLDEIRVGRIGLPMPGTEARIADDGELLLRGPHVMRGYRKDVEKTAEAIDAEGWLHTGDVATVDEAGWYRIVDRKKELIINAGGKNMSPVNIESALKDASPLIGQACCIGDLRPYNVALLVLDPEAAAAWAAANGLQDASPGAVAVEPRVREAIATAVEAANTRLSRIEQVKRWELLATEWLPDGDELTPTMKMRRKGIADKYAATIDALYER